MKTIIFLQTMFQLTLGFSLDIPEYKLCKQKNIPFEVQSSYSQNLLKVKIKAETKITEFNLSKARGIRKVDISKLQELSNINLAVGEITETQVEISNLVGRAFVSFDITYKERGILNKKNILVPVGTLSEEQINDRKKNIRAIKTQDHTKKGLQKSGAISTTTENVHYMKID